jgi:hypothetical protein
MSVKLTLPLLPPLSPSPSLHLSPLSSSGESGELEGAARPAPTGESSELEEKAGAIKGDWRRRWAEQMTRAAAGPPGAAPAIEIRQWRPGEGRWPAGRRGGVQRWPSEEEEMQPCGEAWRWQPEEEDVCCALLPPVVAAARGPWESPRMLRSTSTSSAATAMASPSASGVRHRTGGIGSGASAAAAAASMGGRGSGSSSLRWAAADELGGGETRRIEHHHGGWGPSSDLCSRPPPSSSSPIAGCRPPRSGGRSLTSSVVESN